MGSASLSRKPRIGWAHDGAVTTLKTTTKVGSDAAAPEPEPAAPKVGSRLAALEAGLGPACKYTCYGELKLQMWEKKYDGSKGKVCIHG